MGMGIVLCSTVLTMRSESMSGIYLDSNGTDEPEAISYTSYLILMLVLQIKVTYLAGEILNIVSSFGKKTACNK